MSGRTELLWNWDDGELRIGDRVARFTGQQADVLDLLLKYRGNCVTAQRLEVIWGGRAGDIADARRHLAVVICQMRKRLIKAGIFEIAIRNHFGRGWSLAETRPQQAEQEARTKSVRLRLPSQTEIAA